MSKKVMELSKISQLEALLSYCSHLDLKIRYDQKNHWSMWYERRKTKECVRGRMEGSLILTKTGLFFKKKYAKRFGYALTPSDVLQIEWQMETAA